MAWKIRNGVPVQEVTTGLTPPEVTIEVPYLLCPYCGKEYKTIKGLEAHESSKH